MAKKKTVKMGDGGYIAAKANNKGKVKPITNDKPIEVEGGQVIITKPAVDSDKTYSFEGKRMKPKEIMSVLNGKHGGVTFKKGGVVKVNQYEQGGIIETYLEQEAVQENYRNVRQNFFILDDTGVGDYDIYNISKIKVDNNVNDIYLNTNSRLLRYTISIGDWVYLRNSFYGFFNNPTIIKENIDADSIFPFKPWQLKKIINQQNFVFYLIREVNGVVQKLQIPKRDEVSDKPFLGYCINGIPNVGAILPDNFSETDEIIYPADNGTGFSDAWMYGRFGFYVYGANNLIPNDLVYYQYSVSNDNSVTRGGSYWKKFDDDYLSVRSRHQYTSRSFEDIQQINRLVVIGDVVDIGIKDGTPIIQIENIIESYAYNDCDYLGRESALNIGGQKRNNNYDSDDNDEIVWLERCEIIGLQLKQPIITLKTDGNYDYEAPQIDKILFRYSGKEYSIDKSKVRIGAFYELAQPTSSTTTTISDFDKQKMRARKKIDTADKSYYRVVIDAINDEISLLNIRLSVASNQVIKNQIEEKIAELRQNRDMYELKIESTAGLLDKLAAVNNQPKFSQEIPDKSLLAPNGQPTMLTNQQWHTVRTENFMSWFGDWLLAYQMKDYTGVSKTINPFTQEPLVLYHGSRADFIRWKFDRFPAAYFADNLSYSQWFAENQSAGNENVVYQVFIDMKNPLDMRNFGYQNHTIRTYMEYMRDNYNIPFVKGTPVLAQYQQAGKQAVEQFMNSEMPFWSFIRHVNQGLLTYLRDETYYDGIIMFENNPADIVDGEQNVTGSYVIFRTEQVKWASATHYNSAVKDSRYKSGGITHDKKQKREKIKYAKGYSALGGLDFDF
jgi:hypothetical protein